MGSISEYTECPRCKRDNCVYILYYKSGEEYMNCIDCGYHRTFQYKRTTDGSLMKKDPDKDFSFDNLIPEDIHIENPYGAYRIESIDGSATGGTLETEHDYQQFITELKNTRHDIQCATVSRLIDDNIEKEIIFERN